MCKIRGNGRTGRLMTSASLLIIIVILDTTYRAEIRRGHAPHLAIGLASPQPVQVRIFSLRYVAIASGRCSWMLIKKVLYNSDTPTYRRSVVSISRCLTPRGVL